MRYLLLLIIPVAIAVWLAVYTPPHRGAKPNEQASLQRLEVESAADLEAAFAAMGYSWPPQAVPAVELKTLPDDLADVADVQQRKALFFRALLPIVLAENARIEEMRNEMIALFGKGVQRLDGIELQWLESVAGQYRVEGDVASSQVQQTLLRRVDIVPPTLVLAQAADESGWGTSRFALDGNNLFGEYTSQAGDAIVPPDRRGGVTYTARAFASLDESVRAYIHNINTNDVYQELRNMRYQMRSDGKRLNSHQLATGLEAYSVRGSAYVEEIQAMIRNNRLPSVLQGASLKLRDS